MSKGESSTKGSNEAVVELGPHAYMKPEEVIEYLKRNTPEQFIVVGWDKSGDFTTLSSKMPKKDALWVLEYAKLAVLGMLDE